MRRMSRRPAISVRKITRLYDHFYGTIECFDPRLCATDSTIDMSMDSTVHHNFKWNYSINYLFYAMCLQDSSTEYRLLTIIYTL
jgi:hypothetical protein